MSDTTRRPDRQAVLDAERAVNEQYSREVEALLTKQSHRFKQLAVVQSHLWTSASLPQSRIDRGATDAVMGRVALEEGHPYSDSMGSTFYVAGWRIEPKETDGFETVNWAAPIAGLFFEGRSAGHEIASSVIARRSFVLCLDELIDYSDEIETGIADPFGAARRTLEVPAAPRRRPPKVQPAEDARRPPEAQRPKDERRAPDPETVEVDRAPTTKVPGRREADAETDVDAPFSSAAPSESADPPAPTVVGEVAARLENARAADAVVKVMQMPKQGRMGAVLPTMQPDQYQLVAAAGNRGLVVQGQPGTGKTVVAAHRAVYLTSGERKSERIASVGIVGPSDHYVEHVQSIVSELKEGEADIRVWSLPALMQQFARLQSIPKAGPTGRIESSWELGRAISQFVRSMPDRPTTGRMDRRVRRVVDVMKRANASEAGGSETQTWLRSLPGWSGVAGQARYLPMLATIATSLDPGAVGERVDHLIVDEAQDVRSLEWRLLTGSVLEPGGSLSLFGDMNQRRSDWTKPSWQELAEDIEMTDEAGQLEFHELGRSYRSTRQILRFANQLLPRGERGEHALQDGPQPVVLRVAENSRSDAAFDAAIGLTGRHEGMVAIISLVPRLLSNLFRDREWTRGRWQHSWRSRTAEVVILHPDEARGLEFDAAVVVEPGEFPQNVGRQGVLYTSLTRANKELVVVHSRPLPRGLRPPR